MLTFALHIHVKPCIPFESSLSAAAYVAFLKVKLNAMYVSTTTTKNGQKIVKKEGEIKKTSQ